MSKKYLDKYMQKAKENAEKAIVNNEGGPFGAVIVDKEGKIIANGNNKVLKDKDPTAHAEIVAIREPCPMCLSAIIWANIKQVYYGCTKKDAANIGFRDDEIYEFIKGNNNMIDLKQIDREHCIKIMEQYKKNNGKIY